MRPAEADAEEWPRTPIPEDPVRLLRLGGKRRREEADSQCDHKDE